MSGAAVGLDEAAVEDWFARAVPSAAPPFMCELIAGGHSCLTYSVTGADGTRYALRRPPFGETLATAHDVLREHRIISALAPTDVPVAPVVGACDDTSVIGAPFYVMTFVEGTVLHGGSLDESLSVEARRRASESMVEVLAALRRVDPDGVGLGDYAKRTDYLGRQLKRWSSQWAAADTRAMPRMAELHSWLEDHRPEEGGSGVVHGDFRLGNAIHADDGTVLALLDWELSTLGPPLADLSYFLRLWIEPTAPGFLSRPELVSRYEALTGEHATDLSYWTAFHAWRSACITAGVFTRYKHGNMGRAPADFGQFEDSVAMSLDAGLQAAGIA